MKHVIELETNELWGLLRQIWKTPKDEWLEGVDSAYTQIELAMERHLTTASGFNIHDDKTRVVNE